MTEQTSPSATDVKAWMIDKVARTLEIPSGDVDEQASIMSLGIDSLTLIALAGELAEFTQQEIRAEIIWEYDSIAALAEQLPCCDGAEKGPLQTGPPQPVTVKAPPAASALTMLRSAGAAPPVVSVGFPGIASALRDALPADVPIGWLALDGPYHPPFEVRPPARMATSFADVMARELPQSPVTLVGYSFGGTVAFELACQLAETGRTPRVLLVEPPRVGPSVSEPWGARLRRHAVSLRQGSWADRRQYAGRKCAALARRIRWARISRRVTATPAVRWEVADEFHWEVYRSQIAASLRGYHPRPFCGTLALAGRDDWLHNHAPIWAELVEPSPLLVPLPAASDHQAVHSGPSAEVWTGVLQHWLGGESRVVPSSSADPSTASSTEGSAHLTGRRVSPSAALQ